MSGANDLSDKLANVEISDGGSSTLKSSRRDQQVKSDYVMRTISQVDSRSSSNLSEAPSITQLSVPIPREQTGQTVDAAGNRNSLTVKADADNFHSNAFVKESPTELVKDRFLKWEKVLRSLVAYLKEVAHGQEQIARINGHLRDSVKFSFLTDLNEANYQVFDPLLKTKATKREQVAPLIEQKAANASAAATSGSGFVHADEEEANGSAYSGFMKYGSGSIQDLQVILKRYHGGLSGQEFKVSQEITQTLIPELESLRKEVAARCKEIGSLSNDFQTNLDQHVNLTGKLVHAFNNAVLGATKKDPNPSNDPFLRKLELDIQIKRQLSEENYLKEAYVNLQSAGMQLERSIYTRLQHILQRYSYLIDSEVHIVISELSRQLKTGILAHSATDEWDHFVEFHPISLLNWKSTDPEPVDRLPSHVSYPNMDSLYAQCFRFGYLRKTTSTTCRKSYFLLTSSYLHEFTNDSFLRESKGNTNPAANVSAPSLTVLSSIPLNNAKLVSSSTSEFVLQTTVAYINQMAGAESQSAARRPTSSGGLVKQASSEPLVFKFEIPTSHPTADDQKTFKKWIHDLKYLTSYDSANSRAKYISERLARRRGGASTSAGREASNATGSRGTGDVSDEVSNDPYAGSIQGEPPLGPTDPVATRVL